MDTIAFEAGQHVLVEFDDETMVGGILLGVEEDGGILMKMTHREVEVVNRMLPEFRKSVVSDMEASRGGRLRLAALLSGEFRAVVAGRAELIERLVNRIEADMVGDDVGGTELRELKSPILKYFNGWAIRSIELTTDRNLNAEMSNVLSRMDQELDDLLENGLPKVDE